MQNPWGALGEFAKKLDTKLTFFALIAVVSAVVAVEGKDLGVRIAGTVLLSLCGAAGALTVKWKEDPEDLLARVEKGVNKHLLEALRNCWRSIGSARIFGYCQTEDEGEFLAWYRAVLRSGTFADATFFASSIPDAPYIWKNAEILADIKAFTSHGKMKRIFLVDLRDHHRDRFPAFSDLIQKMEIPADDQELEYQTIMQQHAECGVDVSYVNVHEVDEDYRHYFLVDSEQRIGFEVNVFRGGKMQKAVMYSENSLLPGTEGNTGLAHLAKAFHAMASNKGAIKQYKPYPPATGTAPQPNSAT